MNSSVVLMEGISKSYGPVQVLSGVDIRVGKGEILGLVGKNGAGKSTLMKILAGVETADSGRMVVWGEEMSASRSGARLRQHVAMVFQDRSLVETMSVAENIMLGGWPTARLGLLDTHGMAATASGLMHSLGMPVDVREKAGRLPTSVKQAVEVAKAVSRRRAVLIMDEPAAALASDQVDQLFRVIRALKEQGVALIYISHDLRRVLEVCDRVTVLRDGRVVLTGPVGGMSVDVLAQAMTGDAGAGRPEARRAREPAGEKSRPLLRVRDVCVGKRVRGVTLTLHAGEVVGLVGLTGSGKTELLESLFGILPITSGEVWVGESRLTRFSPRRARRAGLVLVPDERQIKGLVLPHSVRSNLALPIVHRLRRGPFSDESGTDSVSRTLVHLLGIVAPGIRHPVQALSGGNQQKVSLARCVSTKASVFLLDDPTVGVDVQSKREIAGVIRRVVAERGAAALVSSSEADWIASIADRVLVMREGCVVQELRAETDVITEARLVALM